MNTNAAQEPRARSLAIAISLLILHVLLVLQPQLALAQSSATSISFQGALNGTGGHPLPNGSYTLGFQFWDHPTSTAASNRVGSAVTVPGVTVNGGVASTNIPVQPEWFDGQTRYLGITVEGANGGQELEPRVLVTAVPYAVKAGSTHGAFQHFQGLELRWTNDTPYIDFTRSWTPSDLDYDYRVYVDVLGTDPRFVIRSDVAQNCIVIRRNGYVGIGGGFPEDMLDVNGTVRMVVCKITSAREAKQGFAPVDAAAILAKVAALPLSTWAYTNAPAVRHLGPVAQDFHAAFGFGDDDKHVATVDADGVALAAIQGLHQLLQEKEARLAQLESAARAKDAQIASLETRLTALERTIKCRLGVVAETAPGPTLRPFGDPWPPQARTEQ